MFDKIVKYIFNKLSLQTKIDIYLNLKDAEVQTRYNLYRKKYNIHEKFRFNGDNVLFYGNGKISCGFNSYVGNYSTVQTYDHCLVEIGNNCSISHNVRIYTSSKTSDQDLNHAGSKSKKTGNVIIKDGAWIGANVFINPGITIGENSIVGSNSVVTKNVEPNALYGGVPAKLIRYKS
jgi:maltose O-acetyltransferase